MLKWQWILIGLALAMVGSLVAVTTPAQGQTRTPAMVITPSAVSSPGRYEVEVRAYGYPPGRERTDYTLAMGLCPGNVDVPRTQAQFLAANCRFRASIWTGGYWFDGGITLVYPLVDPNEQSPPLVGVGEDLLDGRLDVPAEGVLFVSYIAADTAGTFANNMVASAYLIPESTGGGGGGTPSTPNQQPSRPFPYPPPATAAPTAAPTPAPTATATPDPEPSDPIVERSEVQRRNDLIAAQETLLNGYRCQFGVDVAAVTGGCVGSVPAISPVVSTVFEGVPRLSELTLRDALIASQEALLNAYRCRFNVDLQEVPGGCPG